jgi:putative IMPACT (imprinted ancient) family translation regulator
MANEKPKAARKVALMSAYGQWTAGAVVELPNDQADDLVRNGIADDNEAAVAYREKANAEAVAAKD